MKTFLHSNKKKQTNKHTIAKEKIFKNGPKTVANGCTHASVSATISEGVTAAVAVAIDDTVFTSTYSIIWRLDEPLLLVPDDIWAWWGRSVVVEAIGAKADDVFDNDTNSKAMEMRL